MRAATHGLVGVTTAVVAADAFDPGTAALAVIAASALLGTRLPDADVPRARIYRRTLTERRIWLIHVLGTIVRRPLVFAQRFQHRGITHSLTACAVVSVVLGLMASLASGPAGVVVGSGVAIGYLTHIALDACTLGGVCAWAPFKRNPAWLLPPRARIRTGSLAELGFAIVFAAVATCALALVA
jgi:membrane-bound metal-dependent hydrolase YbcI (DUF457 family)